MEVYKAINAVQADLCKQGITKDRTNTQQGYKFRGIDDVYNTLSPLLAKHNLCILPRMVSRSVAEHTTQKGGVLFYVVVEAEFDFVCASDGSKHIVKTFGEAMDSGDKATNKAMSAAYKYAAFQVFAIPTEGDNDADANTHNDLKPGKGKITPTAGAWESLTIDEQTMLNDVIEEINTHYNNGMIADAFVVYDNIQEVDQRAALRSKLAAPLKTVLLNYSKGIKL